MACTQQPIPAGWRVWRAAVPQDLAAIAIQIRDHVRDYPLGQIAQAMTFGGQTVGFFVSSHTWTYRNGQLVTGLCIPGVSLLIQNAQASTGVHPQDSLDQPDPNAAVWTPDDRQISWPIVAVTAAAIVGICWLFAKAIEHAGKAAA